MGQFYIGSDSYVQKQTGADVLCWQGACIVHDEFKTQALRRMKALYPQAAILVHPESPQAVVELADLVNKALVVSQIFLKIFLVHLVRAVSAKAEGMICATMLLLT